MTPSERRVLERDVAQTLGRLKGDLEVERLDLERLPDALREFAEQIERELGGPVDLGPGIGGVSGGTDPRW